MSEENRGSSISYIYSESNKFSDTKLIKPLLEKRGVNEKKKIGEFIYPKISDFINPFRFENMEKVVSKIIDVKKRNEKIFIYGDYDVDGITGTAFLVNVFRDIGIDTDYVIPNRTDEGYGLNRKNIDFIHSNQGKLIITVDTIFNSLEDVFYARSLGIEVIVTDHHKLVKDNEDDKVLCLNPKFSETYKFKHLSGAGVALKLAIAVCIELNLNLETAYQYLDLIMIGTISDVVPMIGENRVIIKYGLKTLKNTKIKGLHYLNRYLKLHNKEINTTDVSYYISPLINSLGRVGVSKMGVDFLTTDDEFKIYNIIEEMKKLNKKRRQFEKIIYDDTIEQLKGVDVEKTKLIFLSSDKWHPGVVGVVSSKLASKYKVPVVLVSEEGKFGKASCRSVGNYSIFNILEEYNHLFIRFGGHDLAAGFLIEKDKLEEVKKVFIDNLKENNYEIDKKELEVDMELPLDRIDNEILDEMDLISPFGIKNPHPLFRDDDIILKDIKMFGIEERHFSGTAVKNSKSFSVVGFNLGEKIDKDSSLNKNYSIIYYPEKNYIRDEEVIQIKIKDIKIKI